MAYAGVHRAEVKDSIGRLGIRLDISEKIPKELGKIISLSWDQNPSVRPKFSDICDALELFDPTDLTDYPDGICLAYIESELEINPRFSAQINVEDMNTLLLPVSAGEIKPAQQFVEARNFHKEAEMKTNPELERFWNNLAADAIDISWDHFFDHVLLFLDLDNPNEL
jgi:hypothetical protein